MMIKNTKFILGIVLFLFVYGCFFYLNGEVCSEGMYRISENKEYYDLIGRYAEKRVIVDKYGGRALHVVSWKDATNVYDIYYDSIAREINEHPEYYLYDVMRVLSGANFDQSQKLYSILLMQHLSIGDYICLMNVANKSFESGTIDKEVMRFALFPDQNIKNGTSVYYWWLPAWRRQFIKNAYKVADKESVDAVLNGSWSFNLMMQ